MARKSFFSVAALKQPLKTPLNFGLKASDTDALVKRLLEMMPLIATDPALIDSANDGRPHPQGEALSFDGSTQYAEWDTGSIANDRFGAVTIEGYFQPTSTGAQSFWSAGFDNYRLAYSGGFIVNGTSIGQTAIPNVWVHYCVVYNNLGEGVEFMVNGVSVWSGIASAGSGTDPKFYVNARGAGLLSSGRTLNVRIYGDTNEHWPLRHDGKSALTTGNDLTLVGNPPAVVDNNVPVDAANERGFTEGNDSNGAPIGKIILATADNPAIDTAGNPTQWQGSAYPMLPNITGGTAEALTAFNTNLADDGNQPPAILAGGIPATWVHADGSTPVLQVKDNGDATSSLALGLATAPTVDEQETIDKYHA